MAKKKQNPQRPAEPDQPSAPMRTDLLLSAAGKRQLREYFMHFQKRYEQQAAAERAQAEAARREAQPDDQTGERPNDDANQPDHNQLAAGNAMNPNNNNNYLPVAAAATAANGDQMDAEMRDNATPAAATGLPTGTPALTAAAAAVHEAMSNSTSRELKDLKETVLANKADTDDKLEQLFEMISKLAQQPQLVDPARKKAIVQAISEMVTSSFAASLPVDMQMGMVMQKLHHENLQPEVQLDEIKSFWEAALPSMDAGYNALGNSTAPSPQKFGRPHEVNKRILPPPRFSGKKDSTVTSAKSWFTLLMQYFDLCNMDPLEHFMFWLTGKAQEWAADLFAKHKSGAQLLTRDLLTQKFMLQYGDAKRDTAMAARDRLHAHEHSMKQDESVPEYTQRFYDITREAADMSAADQISWYIKGLVPALRGRCATDDEGKDWNNLDKLILYAVGQEVRWKASKEKAHLAEVEVQALTPKDKFSKSKRPPPRSRPPQQGWQSAATKPRTEPACRNCNEQKAKGQSWQDHRNDCIKNLAAQAAKKTALAEKLKASQ